MLNVDIASSGPRANDIERQAETRTGVGVARHLVRILDPLVRSAGRRMEGRNMVAKSPGLSETRKYVSGRFYSSEDIDVLAGVPRRMRQPALCCCRAVSW